MAEDGGYSRVIPDRPMADPGLPSSWLPVDLTAILAGKIEPLVPTVGSRDDGVPLLYAGKTHTLASEPEAGKTWLALVFAQQEMALGRNVVYIDYEDDPQTMVHRLRAMGVSSDALQQHFSYIQPTVSVEEARLEDLVRGDPSLVVIDGVTEAMTIEGLSLVDNQDAAEFAARLATPLSRMGPAVLLLDHEVKKTQDRRQYALGAQHKLAAVTGAALKLKQVQPFAAGRDGASQIIVAKDRPGQLRSRTIDHSAKDDVLGVLVVSSHGADMVEVSVRAQVSTSSRTDHLAPIKVEICDFLAGRSEGVRTKTEIKHHVRHSAQSVTDAIKQLQNDGCLTTAPPFELIKHFEENQSRDDSV